jgi:hypothetical protein
MVTTDVAEQGQCVPMILQRKEDTAITCPPPLEAEHHSTTARASVPIAANHCGAALPQNVAGEQSKVMRQ